MPDRLVEFATRCLDEDELQAIAVPKAPWLVSFGTVDGGRYPQRVMGYGHDSDGAQVLVAECFDGPVDVTGLTRTPDCARYIVRWDPATVLADIAARRAIVAQCERWLSYGPVATWEVDRLDDAAFVDAAETVLSMLVQSWEGRPGWDPAWKVEL